MANVLYDVPLGERIVLSLGAGAGGDNVGIDDLPLLSLGTISGDEWRFAAQGIAQVSYALSPRWQAMLSYRYLHVSGPGFGPFTVASIQETIEFDDLSKHSLSAGLRFDLFPDVAPAAGPAAPPPPPPPAPPPSVKQFIVFFGFDQCAITSEADRVLSEAAATAETTGAARVTIVGHTDTSGSNAYNQRLSDCRAGAAKSNLVAKGVPNGAITTGGRGEAELMVQTGDGVKEPQNRRATVDLQ
jgi:outer membrane protein OmpA-like peptidoglycan-associated protein